MGSAEVVRYGFNEEQINVLKQTICPAGTTDAELALFMTVAQKTGLDPFSRQIYFSERKSQINGQWVSKKTPETTIDGFRVIAERSGKYAGQVGPFWCGMDGVWKDVWLAETYPAAAKVGILREDFREPVWGIALWDEYVQLTKDGKPNSMWTKMGANQLAKCSESLALRKAFPRDLSGMYSREEMSQADNDHGSARAAAAVAERKIADLKAQAAAQVIDVKTTTVPAEAPPANPPTSAPRSYAKQEQEKQQPVSIPEELQSLFSYMNTSQGMIDAKNAVLGYCAAIYGQQAAENDWTRLMGEFGIAKNGPKDIGKVQRALIKLWEIGKYEEARHAREAAQKTEGGFQATDDDLPEVFRNPAPEQQSLDGARKDQTYAD